MFRWLSRYVKQITIMGVGIELREIPEEEALPLLAAPPTQPTSPEPAARSEAQPPIVQRQDFIRIAGTSTSTRRTPRELDLMIDGDEIQLHVHQPGGTQPALWVSRKVLQESLDRWKGAGVNAEPMSLPGRTARKEAEVVIIMDNEEEAEVQAGWWIWVSPKDLKEALEALALRVPW